MGLDMYLNRMPRYRGATAKDVSAVENYLDWIKAKADGSKYSDCTFKEWCGLEKTPKMEYLEFYANHYKVYYSDWDTEHKHPWTRVMEQVGYWRKANQIHRWFVENIQNEIDDCEYHREVTKEDLEQLLDACHEVICNPDLSELRLPTQGGFFFGDTDYGEYYLEEVRETIDIITNVLETTDFDKQMIYYVSSW